MTLTTHAIAGAAIAEFFPQHAVIAFVAGFISHLLLDRIPHWDYTIYSISKDAYSKEAEEKLKTTISTSSPVFVFDLCRIGADFCIGLLLSLIIFSPLNASPLVLLAGAIGGILPDPLQFVYWKIRTGPILWLQKAHIWFHAKRSLKDQPWIGIPFQVAVVLLFIGAVYLAKLK